MKSMEDFSLEVYQLLYDTRMSGEHDLPNDEIRHIITGFVPHADGTDHFLVDDTIFNKLSEKLKKQIKDLWT